MVGNHLDILFDCPYEMHNLTADVFISRIVEELSEDSVVPKMETTVADGKQCQSFVPRAELSVNPDNIKRLRRYVYNE